MFNYEYIYLVNSINLLKQFSKHDKSVAVGKGIVTAAFPLFNCVSSVRLGLEGEMMLSTPQVRSYSRHITAPVSRLSTLTV